ncbi:MAG: hypothetical protein N2047_06240 [Meiothermus sp.]|jgi:hypothetical protein|nr:hypothetical protein [Meiothermus sp.]
MKVIGVPLCSTAEKVASRLRFPDEGAPCNWSAHGERFAKGEEVSVSLPLGDDGFEVCFYISAVRFENGEKGLWVGAFGTYKEGQCCYCGTPLDNEGYECPGCGAS